MQRHLREHATKMLFIGKWTQSVGMVVLIGSGMLHVPLSRFILVNLLATLPKTAVLFSVGYFAGGHVRLFEDHVVLGSCVLGILGVAAIVLVLRRSEAIRTGGAGR
jgi:membrane protein DedA with SNARE-associated domain